MKKISNSNTSIGDSTELKTAKLFFNKGYWAHICPKSKTGSQPVDIIAIRGGKEPKSWLVDAKHVRNQEVSFTFERIEDNQRTSMMMASNYAQIDTKNMGFSIEFDRTGELYWLSYKYLLELEEEGKKSINLSNLELLDEVVK